jgi:hypothetical protein
MMVGLPEFQEHLIRAAYQQDKKARNRAWAIWFIRLMDKGWQAEKGMVRLMADTTLDYWLSPKTCKRCEGVGTLVIDSKVIKCETCDGTGRRQLSDYMVNRVMNQKNIAENKIWVERFRESMAEIDREELSAIHHMVKRHFGR